MYNVNYETINLYVSKDQKLKQVLANLTMSDHGDSSIREDNCTTVDTVHDTKRTLAIAKTAHHGYADLLVQEKTTNNESKLVKNVCVAATTKMTKKYTLQFNGDVYVVPDKLTY